MSVQGGGAFLIAWQLKNKRVIIVGGGDVASGRIEAVLQADAFVTVVDPGPLHPKTQKLLDHPSVTYHARFFDASIDIEGADMIMTAIDDVEVSREIVALARAAKIPVNAADIPPSCDFYLGAQIRDGPLQIVMSTNGKAPRLAAILKEIIRESIPPNAGRAITQVGLLREKLRERAPGVGGKLGQKRMRWMINLCNEWDISGLADIDEEAMIKLLDLGWEKYRVPTMREVGMRQRIGIEWVPAALGFAAGVAAAVALLIIPRLRR